MRSIKSWDFLQLGLLFVLGTVASIGSYAGFSQIKTAQPYETRFEPSQLQVDKFWLNGNIFEAIDLTKRLLEQAKSANQPSSQREAGRYAAKLSILYLDFGWAKDAVAASQEALNIDMSAGQNRQLVAQDKNNLAVAYYLSSYYGEFKPTNRENLLKALQLVTDAGQSFAEGGEKSKVDVAIALHNQALIEGDLGALQKGRP